MTPENNVLIKKAIMVEQATGRILKIENVDNAKFTRWAFEYLKFNFAGGEYKENFTCYIYNNNNLKQLKALMVIFKMANGEYMLDLLEPIKDGVGTE